LRAAARAIVASSACRDFVVKRSTFMGENLSRRD
jgi:hypothetical protein